jgi:ABC-type polysaccharide/polyol phosphate export permease
VLDEVWRYRALVLAFVKRDVSTRYRASAIGWLWALAQPLAQLIVFSAVFGLILKVEPPPLGNGSGSGSYPAFLFTGIVTWGVFTGTLTVSMTSLLSVGDLLRKVHFPPFAPVLGSTLVQFLQVLLEFGALIVVLVFLRNVGWTWVLAVPILLGLLLLSQGVGLIVSVLNARFGDTQYVVGVVLGILYFATPILYPLSRLDGVHSPLAWVVRLNPLTWYVQGMHDVMYSLVAPSALAIAGMLAGGALVFVLGLRYFNRASRDIAESL